MAKQKISIIITVKNDSVAMAKLLEALVAQTRRADEIILSLADSTDETETIAQQFSEKYPQIRLVSTGHSTRSAGRNQGVLAATGDVFVFTDAGCLPQNNWLEELVRPIEENRALLVSGLTLGEFSSAWEEIQIPFVLVAKEKTEKHPLPATRNLAVAKEAWQKIGSFDENLNYAEDFAWARRARSLGIDAYFASDAIVFWRPRKNATAFWKMLFLLTSGDMQAGTWRIGHVSMWARYGIFAFLTVIIGWQIGLLSWLAYLVAKTFRFPNLSFSARLLAPATQILADSAVLAGTCAGLLKRL